MQIKVEDIIDDLQDHNFLKEFIKKADTAVTKEMNKTRVASEVYLSETLRKTGDEIKKSLDNHTKALNESAIAANKHAKGLKVATWALVLATIGLIVATLFSSYL